MEGVAGLHAFLIVCPGWGQVALIHWKTWLIHRWSSVYVFPPQVMDPPITTTLIGLPVNTPLTVSMQQNGIPRRIALIERSPIKQQLWQKPETPLQSAS